MVMWVVWVCYHHAHQQHGRAAAAHVCGARELQMKKKSLRLSFFGGTCSRRTAYLKWWYYSCCYYCYCCYYYYGINGPSHSSLLFPIWCALVSSGAAGAAPNRRLHSFFLLVRFFGPVTV
jgi:hypothetical protein